MASTATVRPRARLDGQRTHESTLPGTWRAGDAHDVSRPGVAIQRVDECLRARSSRLDPGEAACERPDRATENRRGEFVTVRH